MSRYRGPIVKKSRRYGAILFNNGASKQNAYKKRKYPPGMHGRNSFRKPSEYAKQLNEKQKARFLYGICEKKFRRYYKEADRQQGITGNNLLILLEQRLDNSIFRAGFANSRRQARQIASHGLVKVNGRRVTIPSVQLQPGDKFEIRKKNQNSPLFEEVKKTKKPMHPKWLEVDYKKLAVEVKAAPDKDDVEQMIDSQLIVEYYSK